jgi:hypothetical protein
MTPCQYPENAGLFLEPCPECQSTHVCESGDDFDGEVSCNDCGLSTYVCYGTKNAINVWNGRLNFKNWEKPSKTITVEGTVHSITISSFCKTTELEITIPCDINDTNLEAGKYKITFEKIT